MFDLSPLEWAHRNDRRRTAKLLSSITDDEAPG
jgi:hypothetical protein